MDQDKAVREIVYRSTIWIDTRSNPRNIVYYEIEKINDRYHVMIKRLVADHSITVDIHNPVFFMALISAEPKYIGGGGYSYFKSAMRFLQSNMNAWVQNKKRTCISLYTADEFEKRNEELMTFLNKYGEDAEINN